VVTQLQLLEEQASSVPAAGPGSWVLDEDTRRSGMLGVEAARARLAGTAIRRAATMTRSPAGSAGSAGSPGSPGTAAQYAPRCPGGQWSSSSGPGARR
jgi:hypothetical protein